jgi:hypothetical protein
VAHLRTVIRSFMCGVALAATSAPAAQARDDFAMIMDELDFVKAQLARLPTRRDQAFTPLLIVVARSAAPAHWSSLGSSCSGGIACEGAGPSIREVDRDRVA